MSRAKTPDPAIPPFSHPVAVARLRDGPGEENRVTLRPDDEARQRIAGFLGLLALEEMALDATVSRSGDGWAVAGRLSAEVVQQCVVTLEPVPGTIDAPVARRYLPGLDETTDGTDVELGEEDLDAPEPLGAMIDLGQLAVETLALSIDPWPRAADASLDQRIFAAPGVAPMTDEDARPFAGLRALRGGKD